MEYYSETKRNTFLLQYHKDESPGNIMNRIKISSPLAQSVASESSGQGPGKRGKTSRVPNDFFILGEVWKTR